MPDFKFQSNFPIASVIDAAGRNAQLQQQAREAGNKSLIEGLQSIGQVGQSLYDTKKRVAQSLALGRQFGVQDDLARTMTPEQLIDIGKIQKSNVDREMFEKAIAALARPPGANGSSSATTTPVPTSTPTPATPPLPVPIPISTPTPNVPIQPGASLPSPKPEAVLASASPNIPMPAHTEPAATMPFGGASTPTAPSPVPVPIAAPPVRPVINKATADLITKFALANKPEGVVTRQDALNSGTVPKGTHILPEEKGDTSAPGTPAYIKNQEKLEQQYTSLKAKVLSNRSGGLGLEDGKVNQAIHLRKSINQQYDPKTGQYNIPPSLHSEYVLGLARLMSPNGQVAVETMNDLRQRTAREGAANVLISMGFNPEEVGGTTQSVAKFFVKQIDRQGQTAEENRNGFMDYIHGQAPVDLEPARVAAHDKKGLNSFNDLLAKSPDYKPQNATGYEFTNPDKEKRYQEFKARQK